MNKLLYLADRNNSKDNCSVSKTEIIIKAEDTGEVLFKGRNKVVLPGGLVTARAHFGSNLSVGSANVNMDTVLSKYNYDQYLDQTTPPEGGTEDKDGEIVRLFAVGNDGCGDTGTEVVTVKYKDYLKYTDNPLSIAGLIPFALAADDESRNPDGKYFGKRTIEPNVSSSLISTSGIEYSVSDLPVAANATDLEFCVSVSLKISKDECRSLYSQVGDKNKRINSISLLTAKKKVVNNIEYFYNIKPLTKLNFSSEYLIDSNKGIDITYNIYY